MEPFEGVVVEELASSKQLAVDFGQLGLFADRLPILRNGCKLMLDELGRFCFGQMIIWRCREACRKRAGANVPLISMACVASLPVRLCGHMSYAGVSVSCLPSQNAA